MLSRETVIFQLAQVAARLGRKVEAKTFDAYHSFLMHRMSEEQFIHACALVVEEDEKFPPISRLLTIASSYRSRERGVPYVVGGGPLSDCLADLDAGKTYGGDDQFRGRPGVPPMIERLVYEDAAVTAGTIPGETFTSRLRRIAKIAEDEISRLQAAGKGPSSPPAVSATIHTALGASE